MSFRKLLAFILVFSLATQPGGVRFSYAEDTKATEVKIEEKTEASNELAIELDETELDEYLFDPGSREQKIEEAATVATEEMAKTGKISGALAGAIAAVGAAVAAAVGTAVLMIHNGVSNKDEIAQLWKSEEGSFFSRLGKTVSILFKGGNNCRYGENEAGDKCLSDIELTACKYGEDEENRCWLANKPVNEIASLKDYKQKEAERLAKEEAERKAICPLFREANDLIEKKNGALSALSKSENTCNLDTAGFKSELSALDLWTLTTPEELAQAESELNLIINRINDLQGKCSDIKLDKDYINNNWQTVDFVLDPSDASLRKDWVSLKSQSVNEGNLEKLAEGYKNIADRVKAVIDNNNKIPELTSKISKAIEDNKNAEWFDAKYYNEKVKAVSEKKTEENLQELVDLLDELPKTSEANKWLGKIESGKIVKGNCKRGGIWPFGKKLSGDACAALRGKVDEEVKRLKAKVEEDHDVAAFATALNELYEKSQSYIDDAAYLEFDANEAEKIIGELEKIGVVDVAFREELNKKKEYSLNSLKDQRKTMGEFLSNLKDLNSLDSEINKLVSDLGNYKASYVEQGQKKYDEKIEWLKKTHDSRKAVAELKKYREDLKTKIDGVKAFCKNNPKACGKQ